MHFVDKNNKTRGRSCLVYMRTVTKQYFVMVAKTRLAYLILVDMLSKKDLHAICHLNK